MEYRLMTLYLKTGLTSVHVGAWESRDDYDRFRTVMYQELRKPDRLGALKTSNPHGFFALVDVAGVTFQRIAEEPELEESGPGVMDFTSLASGS